MLSMEQLTALMNSNKMQIQIYSKLTTPEVFDTNIFAENLSLSLSLFLYLPPSKCYAQRTEDSGDNILSSALNSLMGCNPA
jgi:hypothetical protein